MSSAAIINITNDNFEQEVLKADRLVLIDFYADWCGPCKAMAPTIEQVAQENPHIKVVKVNIDEAPHLAELFKIRSIPTLITMKDGRGVIGTVGSLPKSALEKFIADALKQASANNIDKPKGPGPK